VVFQTKTPAAAGVLLAETAGFETTPTPCLRSKALVLRAFLVLLVA